MDSLLHLLNIGTLAASLSVVGFGTVGILLPGHARPREAPAEVMETQWVSQDFTMGGEAAPAAEEVPAETPVPEPLEPLPAPPELADPTVSDPLPEVPDFAPPSAPDRIAQTPAPPRQSARADSAPRTARAAAGKPATAGGVPGGSGAGLSHTARLAAGSMPSPAYPAESRRLGQTGTLVVEFTIDTSGRVISAYAKSPSPWPLLNQEAVRTVRRWKFPPGAVMTLQRPIVFQLR